ncbi:MAG: diacylglycerol/lipid kinase family protein [Spirochaetota bacterium]
MKSEPLLDSAVLLINPTRYPGYVRALKRLVKQRRIPLVIETRDREHFMQSVREFCSGPHQYLLVWGGDGTAHLAVNAMMDAECASEKAVGFLRGGTGNGIQDSYSVPFGLSRQIRSYARSITRGLTINVDLLAISDGHNTRYGQLVGFGFDSTVSRRRDDLVSRRGYSAGFLDYAWATVETFFGNFYNERYPFHLDLSNGKYAYRGPRINAEFSFKHLSRRSPAPMIELGTRPYYGKLFKVCPDVVCNDGNLDLYIFDIRRKQALAANVSALWRGKHDVINRRLIARRQGMIERYEVKQVDIGCETAFDYHIDGELMHARERGPRETAELSVTIVPEAIRFLVPEHFYRLFYPFEYDSSFEWSREERNERRKERNTHVDTTS